MGVSSDLPIENHHFFYRVSGDHPIGKVYIFSKILDDHPMKTTIPVTEYRVITRYLETTMYRVISDRMVNKGTALGVIAYCNVLVISR